MREEEPKKSETTEDMPDAEQEKMLKTMRDRIDRSIENESDERDMGEEDIEFINGKQWDESVLKQRGKNRLSLTINKMPTSLDQIDGDIRLNTPGLKVKAVDDAADTDTADIIEGIVRYVQRNSRARKAHSYAGLHAAAGGRGAWRVVTDYISDMDFKQEIRIKRVINAFSIYYDPGAQEDDKQDGMYMFLTRDMSKEEYKETYDFEPTDFEMDGEYLANWQSEGKVRIAEYFYKEKIGEKTIYQIEDGSVADEKPKDATTILNKRKVPTYKIKWALVDGKRVLDEGEVAGTMFPIVLTWGKQLCVGGKLETRGIARHSKDAQRLYNYYRSNDAEATALQPKQPYLIPDVNLTDDFIDVWKKANDDNLSYLPYHVDPNFPNHKPHREPPAMASQGNQLQIQQADSEIRDTIGMPKASLGQTSNEQSGVAIQRRKMEGDTGQFAFIDNLGDAIITEGRIILSMIPEIYDYESQIRILGKDMKEKLITVNEEGGIDLTTGKYDVDISTTSSYSTQREEFQDKMTNLLPQLPPEQIAVFSDILVEMQDFHRADDIAARIKKTIPPELLEDEDDLDENENGVPDNQEVSPEQMEAQQAQAQQQQMAQMAMEMEMKGKQMDLKKQELEVQEQEIKLEQEREKLKGIQLENVEKKGINQEKVAAMLRAAAKGDVAQ